MREALMLQLEKYSYYQHLSLSGGQERPIYSSRVLDIRGSRYHVLSRIQDAGLDFTGRTNFLAHHLVFTPEEIRQLPSPPVILRRWSGWVNTWNQEAQSLESEDWSGLVEIAGVVSVPAMTWQQVTGDAVNGYGLLESRAGIALRVDNLTEDKILGMFAESLELLELRDPRRDFRATGWQYTFTTSMQDQDNPADFRWRCLHSDNPASNRFSGPDSSQLSDVRATRVTSEEKIFAQAGRQPPQFIIQPQSVRITGSEPVRLSAKAEGVPTPSYQWFALDKAGNGQPITHGTEADIVLPNPPFGVSRYVVRASNALGDVTSVVAELSVNEKPRLVTRTLTPDNDPSPVGGKPKINYKREFESLNSILVENEKSDQGRFHWKWLGLGLILIIIVVTGIIFLTHLKQAAPQQPKSACATPNIVQAATNNVVTPAKNQFPDVKLNNTETNNASLLEKSANLQKNNPQSEDFGLPLGWLQIIVGSVTNYRAECVDNKSPFRFDLNAVASGFYTNGDNALFVCKTNPESVFETTLLKTPTNMSDSRVGIMLRDSVKTNSAFLFLGASSQKIFAYRRSGNGEFIWRAMDIPKKISNGINFKFFKTNEDKSMSASYSGDDMKWILFTNYSIPVNGKTLVGFAQISGNNNDVVKARFKVIRF